MKKESLFKQRQHALIETIKKQYPEQGLVVLWAGFERSSEPFTQESSFYYMTGINEPGVVFVMDMHKKTMLFIPHYKQSRAQWMAHALEKDSKNLQTHGLDAIEYLGHPITGYQCSPIIKQQDYAFFIDFIKQHIASQHKIYTLNVNNQNAYIEQQLTLMQVEALVPEITPNLVDISAFIASMRRKKTPVELNALRKAIEITAIAHQAAAYAIEDGASEQAVIAGIDYIFAESGFQKAFPSIVASGKNGTVLHYHGSAKKMRDGELVVVDIGAKIDGYCADISRTYPVSGAFTARQKKLYDIVLETHTLVARLAKPGMWLSNKEKPEQSLYHLALKKLSSYGYGDYFTHGIGHFLGLDVHDVGNYADPLQEGDVITIEPGIYIPEESIGIRIEDDYLITALGAQRLSGQLPQDVNSIEKMVSEKDQEDDEDYEEDYEDN
ncbi:MAG: Xaa-Pro peptidase family protein [Candidatus Babeliaceae bacterium]|jgi:Xaa-Pro aminopeptidase